MDSSGRLIGIFVLGLLLVNSASAQNTTTNSTKKSLVQPAPVQPKAAQAPTQARNSTALPSEMTVKLQKADEKSNWWKDNGSNIVALTGVLVGGLGTFLAFLMHRENQKQRTTELELQEVKQKLESFYRPCHQLLETSKTLYAIFRSRQDDPDNFRTLTALLEGKTFRGNDAVLLSQILEICERVETLIIEKGGLVDPSLQQLFAKAIAHFRVIRLTCRGSIKGEPELFEDYVYPRELNQAIANKIKTLETDVLKLKDH